MPKADFDLIIEGIATNSALGWTSQTLHVPIEDVTLDFRSGYIVPIAGKVSTGGEDDSVNLVTYELIGAGGLLAGAFKPIYERGGKHYYLPEPTGTTLGWSSLEGSINPLAWTLIGEKAPVMCGCAHKAAHGAFAFRKMVEFDGKVYAIDSKNNYVYRKNSQVWEHYVGAGTGWTTSFLTGTITNVTNPAGTTHRVFTAETLPLVNDVVQIASVGGDVNLNSTTANPTWTVTARNTGAGWFEVDPGLAYAAYTTGGTWKATAEALNGTYPTDIFSDGATLYVGTDDGIARKTTNGTTWSNFTNAGGTAVEARCFVLVGEYATGTILWWADDGAKLRERGGGARVFDVGEAAYDIDALEWQNDLIICNKRDGCYAVDPNSGAEIVRPIVLTHTRPSGEARALAAHGDRVYFSIAHDFYSYDGRTLFEEDFFRVDGGARMPFYNGQIISLYSDTQKLYAWLRVDYSTSSYYYLCAFNGSSGGWHPILLVITATGGTVPGLGRPTGALEPAAIFLDGTRLHYSVGNYHVAGVPSSSDGDAATGYLFTNGDVPTCSATEPYTSVAIHLGYYDLGAPAVEKFLKEIRFSFVDQASPAANKPHFYYMKKGDTSWTEITGAVDGTQDNTTLAIPTATGHQLGNVINNQVAFKVEIEGTQDAACYLEKLYLVALPCYTPSQRGSFAAWLYGNTEDNDLVGHPSETTEFPSASTIRAGLKAGILQARPVTMTLPDGTTVKAKLDGGSDQQITAFDDAGNLLVEQKFVVTWREMK